MRLYNEPIDAPPGEVPPTRFRWRDRCFHVNKVVDWWILQGRWWHQEEQRIYYLVDAAATDSQGYFELCSSSCRGWLLVKVYD